MAETIDDKNVLVGGERKKLINQLRNQLFLYYLHKVELTRVEIFLENENGMS